MKIYFNNFSQLHLLFKPSIRIDFEERYPAGSDNLKSAEYFVNTYFMSSLNDDQAGMLIFRKLINKGYTQSDIITAIAKNWSLNNDYFEMPDLNKSILSNQLFMRIILPIIATLLVLIVVMYISYYKKSIIFLDLIAFPPMVGIIGIFIYILFYLIINYFNDR